MGSSTEKTGLWLIGAGGGVGATVALGIVSLKRKLSAAVGLVSALPVFDNVGLVDPGSLVVGGHEIRTETIPDAVRALSRRAGLFDADLIAKCLPDLRAIQRNIRPGILCGVSPVVRKLAQRDGLDADRNPTEAVERLAADLRAFRKRHRLSRVVVINVSSSEAAVKPSPAHGTYARLERAMNRRGSRVVPASAIYALAAMEAGCPFLDFTPSPGIRLPAVQERADALGLPYMGSDGKTGETLVKSVLAPMFAMRNLRVLSWVGKNILGNRDGAVLSDPATCAAKLRSKDKLMSQWVDRDATTRVSIDYVPSLDDWKVAWDFIHFEGFLGTKMNMQFTWQGCDSALAAPLVIDLARFAAQENRGGPMRHLGYFFKDPIDAATHDLAGQWRLLLEHFGIDEGQTR